MNDAVFRIGMKVTIGVLRENEEIYLPSKVENIETDGLVLSMPIKRRSIFFVAIGEKINVYFPKRGSFYCMEAKVEKKDYCPLPLITVFPLGRPFKMQKRKYFRLQTPLKIYFKLSDTEVWNKVYVCDISAGGIKFPLNHRLKSGKQIEVRIPNILDDNVLKAVIVRLEEKQDRTIFPYDIAIKFIDIDDGTRDKIVKYLFRKQMKLIKKGIV